jgi:hypothetical protein
MKVLFATAVLLLAACASSGTKFNAADIDAMQPGVTTEQEAIAKIGKPTATSYGANGSKMLVWNWFETSPLKGSSGAVSVLFDKDGKFVRILSKSGT